MKRGSRLKRTSGPKRSAPLKALGKRKREELPELEAFRSAVLKAHPLCERHRRRGELRPSTDAHHLVNRNEGAGHPDLHNPEKNGAGLCRRCHIEELHGGAPRDRDFWIKRRAWLDAGGRTTDPDFTDPEPKP